MTTASERATLREILSRDGRMEFFYNPPPRVQYYRKDGAKLPNLLPGDAYSMQRYLAKGWTLDPPVGVVSSSEPAYPDTVMPLGATIPTIDRVDAVATAKQERRQALHDEAATGFDGAQAVADDTTELTDLLTEEEEQAVYLKIKARYEAQNMVHASAETALGATASPRGHTHRFQSGRQGSVCLVGDCTDKRQRNASKPAKRST